MSIPTKIRGEGKKLATTVLANAPLRYGESLKNARLSPLMFVENKPGRESEACPNFRKEIIGNVHSRSAAKKSGNLDWR